MKKIKILYDYTPALENNKVGIPVFVTNIYLEIKKNTLFTLHKSGLSPTYLASNSGIIFRLIKAIYYRLILPVYYRLILPLRLLVGRYDVYIENRYIFQPYFVPKRTKIITIIYDIGLILYDDIQTEYHTNYMREFLPIGIRNSDLIVTISESSKKDIMKYLSKIKEEKPINVIYIAPELNIELEIDLSKFNINNKYLLFLGTLEPRKNPLQMIKGFHEFIKNYSSDIKLVCAGKLGWLYDEVMHYIITHNLENKIIFTGYVNEQEKYWLIKKAEGFIFLSRYEGFGIPPLESLSLGTPVLLNDIPVFHEIFEDDAVYVNANNVIEVAEGINELLSIEKTRKYKCLKKFNWKASGEKFSNIIKNVSNIDKD